MTTISSLSINGTDRAADHTGAIRVQRALNAVGSMEFYLDNTDGTYDDLISAEHDPVELVVDGDIFFYGHVQKVDSIGQDEDGRWDKLVWVQAYDETEELLFFDDFEKTYNTIDQTIDDILDDIFNNAGLSWSHISYVGGSAGTEVVGSVEKKDGQSLLGFLQDVHRGIDHVFYVNDSAAFLSKPLNSLTDSLVALSRSNLIGQLRYHRQDASKLYNYVKLTGKNPMFDGYTEGDAAAWGVGTITDEVTKVRVGTYSLKLDNTGGSAGPRFTLTSPVYNYNSFDLTKGILGAWMMYEGASANATRAARVQLYDGTNTINFYSGDVGLLNTSVINQTRLLKDKWCWIEAPLGKDPTTSSTVCDQWWPIPASGQFDWAHVEEIVFMYESEDSGDIPDYLYLDGLSMPVPCIAVQTDPTFDTSNHRRPLSASRADLRNQTAIQRAADTLFNHHSDPAIDSITGLFAGDTALRYGGLQFSADFDMDLSNKDFFSSQLTHIIAPRGDAGKGWEHTMSVEGVRLDTRAFDLGRLGPRSPHGYSIPGIGLKEK